MKKNYRLTEPFLRRVSAQLAVAIISVSSAWAQSTTSSNQPATPPVTATRPAPAEEDVIQLSPFEVEASTRGYLANSAMSGTRLNSKLEDLAASITVVTKEQLADTAALDINDVFKYEASTEGIYQYTSFNVDRGVVTDSVMSNPNGATRMRGLSAANVATNGMETTLPIDTYNIEAIEISRGPNSSIFGLGASGGGVNIITSKANVNKDVSKLSSSVNSFDGYRVGLDLNRVLIRGKLAVRAIGLYDEKGFARKPSSDVTRRMNLQITAQPFKNTTLRGSFESYRNFNSRPNSITPRDMYTDWAADGKPTWNPITQTVNFADGRPSITGVTTALESTLLPNSIGVTDTALTSFPSQYIDNGIVGLYMINRMPSATQPGPNSSPGGTARLLQNSNFYTKNATPYPLYLAPGISDKSLYDWSSVNLSAPNYESIRGETMGAEIEQFFIRTQRHVLAFQGTFLGERTSTKSRRFLGDGKNLQVFIDINEKLLDGSDNPYFLRPYVGGSDPATSKKYSDTEIYRGTLAYQLDLSQERNALKWLGHHNFTGYGEYREYKFASLGFKDTISSTEAWMGTVTSRNSSPFRVYPHYYVGDRGGNVDYAPERLKTENGDQVLRYYNGVTNTWINEPVEFDEFYFANRPNRRLLSTSGANWQGFFWKDRVILNYGIRRDINRTREANSAINPTAATNGYYNVAPLSVFSTNDWVQRRGQTTNKGAVVKPLDWLHLTYSESDSFSPSSLAYDIYGRPLNDPRGQTKDYGFSLNLFHDKLTITAKQYETLDIGRGTSELNTIVQRAIRLDADGNDAIGAGSGDPDLERFYTLAISTQNPTWTQDQIDAETARLMGVSPAFIDGHRNKTHGDGSNAASRGKEIEISFNPNRYWTLKANIVQQKAFNGLISPDLQKYLDERLPVWKSAVNPYTGERYWDGTYTASNLTPEAWYTRNVLAEMKKAIALQGKARSQVREWRVNMVTKYKLAGLTDQRWLKNIEVGGGVRWEDKATIGYLGGKVDADGILREYDVNKPVYDKARYYVDFMTKYRFKLFNGRVDSSLQLNVSNVFEDGRLQAVAVNPDGRPYLYRIIDSRMFTLSATFDL